MKLLKKYKKLYKSYAKTAVIAGLFLLVAIPFVNKVSDDGVDYTPDSRYMVVLNGEELGYVSDSSIAENALLSVRSQLGSDTDGLALVEADMECYENTEGGSVLSEEEITETIYNNLVNEVVDNDTKTTAYTVRIDDFTVTLESLDDVSELLNRVKSKYADADGFTVEFVPENNGTYTSYTVDFVTADKAVNDAAKVLATEDGEEAADTTATEDVTYTEGVLSVGFLENVEIIETKSSVSDIESVDDAYELITKEHTEKGKYTVVTGDCLSSIARDHNLSLDELLAINYGFTADTAIYEGDEIVVTVPTSEISVTVVEEKAYDENYNAEVQYVDNPSLYIGTENVIQAGVQGSRSVVALVTYVNGEESDREIIKQDISVEAVPEIIERGTLTPPTYIKPINGGMVTSNWGYRGAPFNSFHYGVDWYVPVGTSVKASSSGTVTIAGWYGNYGYCVEIVHSDGSKTRYAHLSQIAVSYGQSVLQGQLIAYSGNTGYSTGPHLHFEIWIGGASVNPLAYVQ